MRGSHRRCLLCVPVHQRWRFAARKGGTASRPRGQTTGALRALILGHNILGVPMKTAIFHLGRATDHSYPCKRQKQICARDRRGLLPRSTLFRTASTVCTASPI